MVLEIQLIVEISTGQRDIECLISDLQEVYCAIESLRGVGEITKQYYTVKQKGK